jgi:hypothetical protein
MTERALRILGHDVFPFEVAGATGALGVWVDDFWGTGLIAEVSSGWAAEWPTGLGMPPLKRKGLGSEAEALRVLVDHYHRHAPALAANKATRKRRSRG